MTHEKTFILAVGREAKIILHGKIQRNGKEIEVGFEFLIKDSHDQYFHSPIGINHPQYWKLKKSTQEKAQLLQMEYSGVSRKQLNEAIREFRHFIGPGFNLKYNVKIQDRIKTLKGIRLSTGTRRMLAAV